MQWTDSFELSLRPVSPAGTHNSALLLYWGSWMLLYKAMTKRARKQSSRQIFSHYIELQENHWRESMSWLASPERLLYSFSDEQGNAALSCTIATHWCSLALALHYDEISQMAAHRGFELLTPRPILQELLEEAPPYPLLTLGSTLVALHTEISPWELRSDFAELRLEELTDKETKLVKKVVEEGRCCCEICEKLRKEQED